MKKHRNFIIFYSLWLLGIMGIFVAFGEESPNEYLKEDTKICTTSVEHIRHINTEAYDYKPCELNEL